MVRTSRWLGQHGGRRLFQKFPGCSRLQKKHSTNPRRIKLNLLSQIVAKCSGLDVRLWMMCLLALGCRTPSNHRFLNFETRAILSSLSWKFHWERSVITGDRCSMLVVNMESAKGSRSHGPWPISKCLQGGWHWLLLPFCRLRWLWRLLS